MGLVSAAWKLQAKRGFSICCCVTDFVFYYRLDIQGRASGGVNTIEVDVGLDAQLKKLTKECSALSDMSIKYYSTDLPSKAPTNLNELVELIKGFPSRLEKINKGKGIPLEVIKESGKHNCFVQLGLIISSV